MFLYEQQVPDYIVEKFGEILFGSYKGTERDTNYEQETFLLPSEYYRSFNHEGQRTTSEMSRRFKELLDIKNDYDDPEFDDVLDPFYKKNHKSMYRGLTISGNDLFSNMNKEIDFGKLRQKQWYGLYYDITKYSALSKKYKPLNEIESWTFAPDVAHKFSTFRPVQYDSGINDFRVVIEFPKPKSIQSELLFEPTFFDDVNAQVQWHVLRISKKPLKGCKVYMFDWPLQMYLDKKFGFNDDGTNNAIYTPNELADNSFRKDLFPLNREH